MTVTGDDADRRRRGLETMRAVYGWEFSDGPDAWFGITADHLFAEIWNRPGLSLRDRRLLLIGLLLGQGHDDVAGLQMGAALRVGDLSLDELTEITIFLTHYAGWPAGAKLNARVGEARAEHSAPPKDADT